MEWFLALAGLGCLGIGAVIATVIASALERRRDFERAVRGELFDLGVRTRLIERTAEETNQQVRDLHCRYGEG